MCILRMYIYIYICRRKEEGARPTRPSLVPIRITVTPDHPQFYHPPFRKDSNFLLPPRSFLSTSLALFPRVSDALLFRALSLFLSFSLFPLDPPLPPSPPPPPPLPPLPPIPLLAVRFFATVHGLNLCLIADYWDFARMRKERRPWLARPSELLGSAPGSGSWKTADKDESLIPSVSRSPPGLLRDTRRLPDR